MADVGKRLYGPAQPGAGDATIYTAPAGGCVVRSIHADNSTALAATLSLAINGTAATAANCWVFGLSLAALGPYDWTGFLWLGNGDTLHALQGTVGAITLTISGIEQ